MKMFAKIFLQWRKTEVGEESKCKILANFYKSNRRAMQAFHNFVNSQHCMAKF